MTSNTRSKMGPTGDKHHVRRIRTDETALEAIVGALSAVTGTDQMELPPLYHSVEVDSIDALMDSTTSDLRIEFSHHGHHICIDGDTVSVERVTAE